VLLCNSINLSTVQVSQSVKTDEYTSYQHELKSFIRKLVKPISKKLGWDPIQGESGLNGMCRATILKTLGVNGDLETIAEAKKRFEAHLVGKSIPADLRAAVYSSVLTDCDTCTVDKFIELHNNTDLQEEKVRLATSLGAVCKEDLIGKVLQFAISPAVRSQDAVSVICSISGSCSTKLSSDLTWQFVKDNWDVIYGRYSSGFLITRLVKSITENFATADDFKDVDTFFKTHPVPAAQRSIQQALESIQVNTEWLNRNKDDLKSKIMSI